MVLPARSLSAQEEGVEITKSYRAAAFHGDFKALG